VVAKLRPPAVTPPAAIVTVPAVEPPKLTISPETHAASVEPLNQLAVEVSHVPLPPPLVLFLFVGSQLRVCAFAVDEAARMVAMEPVRSKRVFEVGKCMGEFGVRV
jgi:hypothetical protein